MFFSQYSFLFFQRTRRASLPDLPRLPWACVPPLSEQRLFPPQARPLPLPPPLHPSRRSPRRATRSLRLPPPPWRLLSFFLLLLSSTSTSSCALRAAFSLSLSLSLLRKKMKNPLFSREIWRSSLSQRREEDERETRETRETTTTTTEVSLCASALVLS